MKIQFDKYSLIIDGKRTFIRSGSFHYFRLPAKRLWRHRLQLIKQAGLNCVDFYFPWNFHSPKEGVYDFSGLRDIDYLMDLAEDLGLYVIARPGPYICAEVDGGGFPGWLIAKKNVVLRCRKNGKYKYSPEYMKYVRQWYEQIVPKISKHKNVILFQIENEYSSYLAPQGRLRDLVKKLAGIFPVERFPFREEKSKRYLKELYTLARQLGIKTPIFHNDLPIRWGISLDWQGRIGVVDIVGTDDYSFFGQSWKRNPKPKILFSSLDFLEKWLRRLNPTSPLFITELQGGWFDNWGGQGYDTFRKLMGLEHIDIVTRTALAQGITLFNYYMFCGGTNWGYLGAPCVYTSYDFGAPVSEAGLTGPRYETVKEINRFIKENELNFCLTEEDKSVKATNKKVFYKARINPQTQMRFVFLRNLTKTFQATRLNILEREIKVPPFSMPILVFDKKGELVQTYPSYVPLEAKRALKRKFWKGELKKWKVGFYYPQKWQPVAGKSLDFDSLGIHYGFAWYQGKYRGKASRLLIDARHCYTIWLNNKLVSSFNEIKNLADGLDLAKTRAFLLKEEWQSKRENSLIVLAESLGHKKDFEDDAQQPRGIVKAKIPGKKINWQVSPGLIAGESGLCPVVNFSKLKLPSKPKTYQAGVLVSETEFVLPKQVRIPIGLRLKATDKTNIYLNRYLLGRYCPQMGPQEKFYLPDGILKTSGENKLVLVLWPRSKEAELENVCLEEFETNAPF